MIVVADTSPLNYLVRAGYISILPDLFGRVLVPIAVMTELRHPDAPAQVRAFADSPPSWLECVAVQEMATDLPTSLGDGERQAISLALERHADALLIDDWSGRREAEARQIPARGTLAVLLQASLRGQIHFPTALDQIIRAGFRVSHALRNELLEQYRDRESR
jgi:predicted nucleic acid-binding protein